MKRILISLVVAVALVSLVSLSWAGMVRGTLEKIDGEFYVVKDKDGKEHRIHFNDTTKTTGEVKAGAQIEVDEANGHAKSIKVMEMKMEKKEMMEKKEVPMEKK